MIATFFKDKFIRPILGDVLVVILLFSFCRIFYHGNSIKLIIGVLIFAFIIEILQYFQFASLLGLENNKIAKIVLGSTFDWLDLLAYSIGALLCFPLDNKLTINYSNCNS
ncbi:DUF2809 domain-containing protein [Lutibacter sp. Hel_I_33_5]|uniref:ribosomal maturation YjgA family protein n=1 Tax=Lutibacter sp. Hel_I_33_5 TaxID=1566289 RepID=UPI00210233D4|nr:DUF2809 domain-containing protein [Lutibacter sp. Hel_I_33_5]